MSCDVSDTRRERGLQTSRGQLSKRERLGTRLTLEYFGNRALCLSRSRFHLSSVGPCKKKEKNTAKGKEAFQGKFVVIVEGFAR